MSDGGERPMKGKGLDAFQLKLIAIIGMTSQHFALIMGELLPFDLICVLYVFGGITFPIMAYLLCEGYQHTRNVKNYASRLLLFAVISELPYFLFLMQQLNILFTLFLGLLAIHFTRKVTGKLQSVLLVSGLIIVSITCDWGLIGVPMVLSYFYLENRWLKLFVPVLFPILLSGFPQFLLVLGGDAAALPELLFVCGSALSVPLLSRYNTQRGRTAKYFFYAYYPIHILIIGILHAFITL